MCGVQEDFNYSLVCRYARQLASDSHKFHGEQTLISKKTESFV